MTNQSKFQFLAKNLFRAVIYALIIGIAYYLFKEYFVTESHKVWLEQFYNKPVLIYLIYSCSEILFGLFPPEFFMLWAYHKGDVYQYMFHLALFAGISYGAGYLAFIIGHFLRRAVFFRFMSRKFFLKYWPLFRRFGSVLIISAALTPLPWALISMLVGTTTYPLKRFTYIALFRILRFVVYGFIIYQTHLL